MTRKLAVVAGAAALLGLLTAAPAFAHAELSPPVALAKTLQLFTLAVPTEKEGATTTTIELTLPSGFSIDSFVAIARLEARDTADGLGRGRRHPEGDVDRRQRADRTRTPSSSSSPAPARRQDLHVRRPPDLLGRIDRRLVGAGVVRHARADDRGQELTRRRRLARRSRSSRWRSRRSRSCIALIALFAGRRSLA